MYYSSKVTQADYAAQFGEAALKKLLDRHEAEERERVLFERRQIRRQRIEAIKGFLTLKPLRDYVKARKAAKARKERAMLIYKKCKATMLKNGTVPKRKVSHFRKLAIQLQQEK